MRTHPVRFRLSMVMTLAAALTCTLAQADGRSSKPVSTPPFTQLTPHEGVVSFQQVNWDLEHVQKRNSNWGQVTVDPNRLRHGLRHSELFINVLLYAPGEAAPFWSVENLHVPAASCSPRPNVGPRSRNPNYVLDSQPPVCMYFNLRPGGRTEEGPVKQVQAAVLVSDQPVPVVEEMLRPLSSFRPMRFAVRPVTENTEGFLSDPLLGTFPPRTVDQLAPLGGPPAPLTPAPGGVGDLLAKVCIMQESSPNIECAKNQCVPMAQSNTIQYLENRYSGGLLFWNLPHFALPGIGRVGTAGDVFFWEPVPPYSLVANVDFFTMRTGVFDNESGDGATICQLYRGLFGYLQLAGPYTSADFRHQGTNSPIIGEDNTCDSGTVIMGGRTSVREGLNPTWEWMFEQLSLGRGVTICFGRYDSNGERTSGHCVRVFGACQFGNNRYLYTLDDGEQGDNNTGTRTQVWLVADTGGPGQPGVPDGRLNMGGLSWEIEFANSIHVKPTLLIP